MITIPFCPESDDKIYTEVQVDRRCQIVNGILKLEVTLMIPSDALQLSDKNLKVFGENLHPTWGEHRTNSGRVKVAPQHEFAVKTAAYRGIVAHSRVKSMTVTLEFDDPEEIVTKSQETFREVVREAQDSLSAYFEKQVKVFAAVERANL